MYNANLLLSSCLSSHFFDPLCALLRPRVSFRQLLSQRSTNLNPNPTLALKMALARVSIWMAFWKSYRRWCTLARRLYLWPLETMSPEMGSATLNTPRTTASVSPMVATNSQQYHHTHTPKISKRTSRRSGGAVRRWFSQMIARPPVHTALQGPR